jgi:hypothetical protein
MNITRADRKGEARKYEPERQNICMKNSGIGTIRVYGCRNEVKRAVLSNTRAVDSEITPTYGKTFFLLYSI